MFDILFCVRDQHDIRLVLLAATVCLLSMLTAVLLLRQSRLSREKTVGRKWAILAGFAVGFGIWATHFIAMLGYDPGIITGYGVGLTSLSLAIVLVTTIKGFLIARSRLRWRAVSAAVLIGGGFSTMHYVGMQALEMPAIIQWKPGYVALSLLIAIVPFYPALRIVMERRSRLSGFMAGLLMCLAVVGLHFTGMTAIHLIPSQSNSGMMLLSPRTMSIIISAVSAGLLLLCMLTWAVARRTRAAIAASERQFSALVHGISDCAIYMLDRDGRVANWNAGAQRLKGYDEAEVVGFPLAQFYIAEDREAGAPARALAIAAQDGMFKGEGWRVRKDGTCFWAHVTIERMMDDVGVHIGFAKITRDMTRFKEDQDRIEEARAHLDAALEHMHQGLCLYDAKERLVLRNRQFARLWNLPEDSCPPGTAMVDVSRTAFAARTGDAMPEERLANMRALLAQSLENPDMPPIIFDFSEDFVVSIASRALPSGGWVTTFEDITERRRSEIRIAHMAHHDGLTGLPNRTSFNRWLDGEIGHGARNGEHIALVAIDLDRFKEINDSQGHAAGDEVLQRIAQAMTEATGEGETVARLGGDEFAAAKTFIDPAELDDFVARLSSCFNPATDGQMIGASLGVAIYPSDGSNRETLLNNADLAMYRAKASLNEHICYYEPGMDEQARHRRMIATDLRQAIARNEFHLLYQPQRTLKDDRTCGYEALLRWNHPLRGSISPVEFIPIAEETGEIIRIGEWVLREACAEAGRWAEDHKVAVNLSPVQLLQPDLPEIVTAILLETGLSPRRLELEITETAIITDKVRALHSLRRIKALGVSVAIDDFGTGYSSLDTLHSFPFDKIKIDKSFLLQSGESEQARAIIRAVLALGKSLKVPVLAEGVETREQFDLLRLEGCEEGQGYYFGRPAAMRLPLLAAAR